ncbi:FHA domain-containing protein [Spirulina sp. 06S082]|uniref:FHA domain-containing protein n=1 Tax=Spirulina sp. 06S082 TaxID=3110248 RepID=UPI002B1F21F5|nr:FHA domain-containing protein [Spirulina sp. 06S082]MEA5472089.1 FHA domain-containing protein [Spirulina sp. 06S082]
MIVITLLHPSKSAPVQSWVFESEAELTLGRGSQNDVVLYSAVVSRRHAKLQQIGSQQGNAIAEPQLSHDDSASWEIVNFGANGTYVDGKVLAKEQETIPVYDGTIVRLGETGPKIRIRLGAVDPSTLGKVVRRRSSLSPNLEFPREQKARSTFLRAKSDPAPPDSTTNID